jgi:hypothetical protein
MAQSKLSLPDSGDLHLVSGPRTTPTVFVVDWHATGLALAGVVLAAGGVWLRWRSPRRASVRGRLSPLSRWHYSSGSGLDRDQPLQAGRAGELPRGRRRASTRSPRPRRRRMLVRMDLAEIVDQRLSPSTTPPTACPARHRNRSTAPPIRPVGSRGVHGQSWRQERFWCRGQTCPPFGVAPNLHTTVEAPIRQRAQPGNCQRPIQHASPNPQSGPARRSFPSPAAAAPWANW